MFAMSLDKAALVTMYHGDCSVTKRKQIEADLRDPNGAIRLVIVSSALGRGANYPNINRLIFLRAPLSLVCARILFRGIEARSLTKHVRSDTAQNSASTLVRHRRTVGGSLANERASRKAST